MGDALERALKDTRVFGLASKAEGRLALDDLGPSQMRRFVLERNDDVHDTSGTGDVVEGVEFSNGKVAACWRTKISSVVVYDGIGDVEEIHGHGGKTTVRWLDSQKE